jgi:hypothetical protein
MIRTSAASEGSVGLELVHDDVAGATRHSTRVGQRDIKPSLPAEARIYQVLVDVKDGSGNGGSDPFLCSCGITGRYRRLYLRAERHDGAGYRVETWVSKQCPMPRAGGYSHEHAADSSCHRQPRLLRRDAGQSTDQPRFENSSSRCSTSGTSVGMQLNVSNDGTRVTMRLISRSGTAGDGGFGVGDSYVRAFGGNGCDFRLAKKVRRQQHALCWAWSNTTRRLELQTYGCQPCGSTYQQCVTDIILHSVSMAVAQYPHRDNTGNPAHDVRILLDTWRSNALKPSAPHGASIGLEGRALRRCEHLCATSTARPHC